jgi:hypothetical protein
MRIQYAHAPQCFDSTNPLFFVHTAIRRRPFPSFFDLLNVITLKVLKHAANFKRTNMNISTARAEGADRILLTFYVAQVYPH